MGVAQQDPHIPVLLAPLLAAVSPVQGDWIDGTFGAGGYTIGLLNAGAGRVMAIDRDPAVFTMAESWQSSFGERLLLTPGRYGDMDVLAEEAGLSVQGVVLDIGVSSMQIDQAERGFSFMRDGPLDMRMEQTGPSAADIVNGASEAFLADLLYQYGEERASRRIARAIVADRKAEPFTRTGQLSGLIERVMPRPKPGQVHPATRSFQALRIAVNDELGQLAQGLMAAEAALQPGGLLAVVTFHSLEDRIVKRFLQLRSDKAPQGSRYAPPKARSAPTFEVLSRKAVVADEDEMERNPRARSAKLRVARRTTASPTPIDNAAIGLPKLDLTGGGL